MVARCHISVSAGRSADCPTTGWCRDSFRVLKLPRYDSARACRDLDARLFGTLEQSYATPPTRNGLLRSPDVYTHGPKRSYRWYVCMVGLECAQDGHGGCVGRAVRLFLAFSVRNAVFRFAVNISHGCCE